MEAKDLRIGNYVDWKTNKSLKIEMLDGECGVGGLDCVELCPISDWKPIPLTEEWLVKFGFGYNCYTNKWGFKGFVIYWDAENIRWFVNISDGLVVDLTHVHILQNTFALTGEELTIKT